MNVGMFIFKALLNLLVQVKRSLNLQIRACRTIAEPMASTTCEARECFRVVYEGTSRFRKDHIQRSAVDTSAGLKFWKLMKHILEEFDDSTATWNGEWISALKEIYRVDKMEEFCPEYDVNGEMIEHNHFMLQVLRIPAKEALTLRKLCQVALNLGQLSAHESCFTGRLADIFALMMEHTSSRDYSSDLSSINPPVGTAEALRQAMDQYGVEVCVSNERQHKKIRTAL